MIKQMRTYLGLIKREVIQKFTITCDCCCKETTLEKRQEPYSNDRDSLSTTGALQQQINSQALHNNIRKLGGIATTGGAIHSSGVMQGVGREEILPPGWFTFNQSFVDMMPATKTLCSEECLIKVLEQNREEMIKEYRKKQLDNLRK